jgi:hypothetical protein
MSFLGPKPVKKALNISTGVEQFFFLFITYPETYFFRFCILT